MTRKYTLYLISPWFYSDLRLESVGKSAQTYEECSNSVICSRLSLFLYVFGQVKEWLILQIHA